MLADGLTKIGARQSMVEKLASGKICLHFDPNFLAAKKKTPAERQKASDRAYGSQVARKIAQVLAINSLCTAGDAANDFKDSDTPSSVCAPSSSPPVFGSGGTRASAAHRTQWMRLTTTRTPGTSPPPGPRPPQTPRR